MIALPDAEEATERHHGEHDIAAQFVEHDVLDGADMFAGLVVDVGSLDLFRQNEAGMTRSGGHEFRPPGCWDWLRPSNATAGGGFRPGYAGIATQTSRSRMTSGDSAPSLAGSGKSAHGRFLVAMVRIRSAPASVRPGSGAVSSTVLQA